MKAYSFCHSVSMESGGQRQIHCIVKYFTSRPLPFENSAFKRIVEFRRVSGRSDEEQSNTPITVLHDFAGAPSGVRRLCTIERKIVLRVLRETTRSKAGNEKFTGSI